MNFCIKTLETNVHQKIKQEQFEAALSLVVQFVRDLIHDPYATAVVFSSKRLDLLCLAIGDAVSKSLLLDIGVAKVDKYVVTILSHLECYGGHTLILEDLLRAQQDKIHILLVTDLFNVADAKALSDRFSPIAELRMAPLGSMLKKMEWLLEQLLRLNPERILLLAHHEDAVVIGAIQPWLESKVFFYHHADHNLCLGVHLPGAFHIDPHNLGFYNCRFERSSDDNLYLPLMVEDRGMRPVNEGFLYKDSLLTCTSGTFKKFDIPYAYNYFELIPKMLALTGGKHLHIGNLPENSLKLIHERLVAEKVDVNRFRHIPWVPSVWSALIDNSIDLYISSFPLGGGRASIEAMGSGTPILMHESYLSRFHGGVDLAYPEVLVWREPSEFYEKIRSIRSEALISQSRYARQHYETYHSRRVMDKELDNIFSGKGNLIPPVLMSYAPDVLQKYLYTRDELRNEIEAIQLTLSWRITKPLRTLSHYIRQLIRLVKIYRNYQAIYPGFIGCLRFSCQIVHTILNGGVKELKNKISLYERINGERSSSENK